MDFEKYLEILKTQHLNASAKIAIIDDKSNLMGIFRHGLKIPNKWLISKKELMTVPSGFQISSNFFK